MLMQTVTVSCLTQLSWLTIFFIQAEDGIRDLTVTGVQTCALPISPRRAHPGAHVYRGVRAPRRGGPHAVRLLERELGAAGAGGRQSHGSVPRGARARARGAARKGRAAALHRGAPRSAGAASGALRGRGGAYGRQRRAQAPGGRELRRTLGYYSGNSKACERMLEWCATAGGYQRGPLRRAARTRGSAAGGSADPHRR